MYASYEALKHILCVFLMQKGLKLNEVDFIEFSDDDSTSSHIKLLVYERLEGNTPLAIILEVPNSNNCSEEKTSMKLSKFKSDL